MTNTLLTSDINMVRVTNMLRSAWQVIQIWSDLILVMLLLLLYFAYGEYQHQNRMQLINEPKINDFYFVDYHLIEPASDVRFRYIPLKVSSIDGDLITFKLGNIGHSTQVSATEHVKYDMALKRIFFRPDDLVVSRQTIFNWADEGIIYDIARPTNIFINGWIVMNLSDLSTD
ncbi:hypothetical protein [Aliiglaciecola sp. LCG003]|uniref:hypothetical protein n=1 Tax=Aliiglaciecola sp. LCG003 TaxID=3053655 RepID=UPI002572718C|nr:hypothetical protein [Aliiglaciecola sp. LCG003]WJG09066.1 hypothetical protein QR722_17320 [Aliiglaciecola sp. LCG003]